MHPSIETTEATGSPEAMSIDTRLLAGESNIVRALEETNARLKQENARLLEIQQLEDANERLLQERAAQLQNENEVKEAENKRLKNERAADSSMNHAVKAHAGPAPYFICTL
jgi:hypothetical protein